MNSNFLFMGYTRSDVINLVESGNVKPIYSESHPLEEAESVLERMAKGKYVGRPVLVP